MHGRQGVVADVHQPTVCDIVADGARVSNVNQAQLETVREPPAGSMLVFCHTLHSHAEP